VPAAFQRGHEPIETGRGLRGAMHKNDIGHRSDANADRFAPAINFALSVDLATQVGLGRQTSACRPDAASFFGSSGTGR
jgi:hypothetical protein